MRTSLGTALEYRLHMLTNRTSIVASLALVAASLACAPPRECNAQNDCPTNEGCTADGRCVAVSSAVALADARGDNGLGASGAASTPPTLDATPGTLDGLLGPLHLEHAPMTSQPTPGNFAITADGNGADALVLVFAPGPMDLTTPGTHHYDANDLTAVAAQACTTNESAEVTHFDEPASVDVTVATSGAVALRWTAIGVDVTATFASAPPQ